MYNYFDNSDWRKQAAVTATSDQDIEKAFSDQASGFVENKLAPLMKAPYSIGFEIVRKNDDNTRMVGVFAFKVEESILLAPVFFLNGDIKGPLLYRCDTRTFVPANKEWAMYMIESLEVDEGKGISVSRRNESAPLVQMQRINFLPASYAKRASAEVSIEQENHKLINLPVIPKKLSPSPDGSTEITLPENNTNPAKNWNKPVDIRFGAKEDGTIECCCKEAKWKLSVEDAAAICDAVDMVIIHGPEEEYELSKEAALQIKEAYFNNMEKAADWAEPFLAKIDEFMSQPAGLIRDFLSEPGVGEAAIPSIIKAASENYDFGEMLAYRYNGLENFIPEVLTPAEGMKKKASAPETLEICYTLSDGLTKKASSSLFIDGFVIKDTRNPEKLVTRVEEAPVALTAPSETGVYSVLKSDGTFEDNVLVTYPGKYSIGSNQKPHLGDSCCESIIPHRPKTSMILIKDGKLAEAESMLAIQTGNANDWDGYTETPSEGSIYVVAYPDNVSHLIYIKKVEKVDGVYYLSINTSNGWSCAYKGDSKFDNTNVVYNPSLERSDLPEGVIGGDAKFIKLKSDSSETVSELYADVKNLGNFGGMASFDKFLYTSYKMPKVTITETGGEKKAYVISCNGETSGYFTKLAMMVKLTQDMLFHADEAMDIMDNVDSNGVYSFTYPGMEKMATNLRVVDRPYFDDLAEPSFGIPLQPERVFKLRIQGDQVMEPASAVGDAFNPESATGLPNLTVISTAPEELRTLADVYKLPNVFEHGVVGTLADTFNALSLVDKYVAKIEDAVDSLGRMKFLILWCPQDFEKAYGADDMVNLTASIDSNFDSLGAVLLNLLKKTDQQRRGINNKKVKED